nr:MAG TPA: YjcQ protein [Caudoviricetes sp.]
MKINPDCVRDLLIYCVKNTSVANDYVQDPDKNCIMHFHILCVDSMIKDDALAAYSFGELVYHIIQLSDDGFLATDYRFHREQQKEKFPAPRIFYVTPKGHNFVSETYEKQRWNSVKKALSAVGSVSLPVMEQVAGSIATAAISQLLTGGNVTGA